MLKTIVIAALFVVGCGADASTQPGRSEGPVAVSPVTETADLPDEVGMSSLELDEAPSGGFGTCAECLRGDYCEGGKATGAFNCFIKCDNRCYRSLISGTFCYLDCRCNGSDGICGRRSRG